MAFTLINGASRKTVNTEWQRDELVQRGWTLEAGGVAGTATDIHNFTNPTPKDFKGIGFEGEDPKSIGYAAKKQTEGATQKEFEGLNDIMHKYGDIIPDAATYSGGIETVAALPSSGEETKVYLLTVKDTVKGKIPGAYIYKDGAWTDYTV